jgi:hypothetical protein
MGNATTTEAVRRAVQHSQGSPKAYPIKGRGLAHLARESASVVSCARLPDECKPENLQCSYPFRRLIILSDTQEEYVLAFVMLSLVSSFHEAPNLEGQVLRRVACGVVINGRCADVGPVGGDGGMGGNANVQVIIVPRGGDGGLGGSAYQSNPSAPLQSGCGWYVVTACKKSYDEAASYAMRFKTGSVINTSSSEYKNFRPGFFCVASGPTDHATAVSSAERWRAAGVSPNAYAKNGC